MISGSEGDRTDPAKELARRTLPLLSVVFIMVGSVSTLWPILTPYARDLGAGGVGIGLVVGAIYGSRLFLQPVIGRLADRHGYRLLLLFGTLLYVPIAVVYASASNVAILVIARLLHGVGSAIVLPMVMAVLGQHSAGKSGAAMARFNVAQWLGYAVGPLLGGGLAAYFDAEVIFLLLAPAGVISAIAVMLVDQSLMAAPKEAPADPNIPLPTQVNRFGQLLLGYNFIVAPAALIILSFFPLLAESRGYGSFLIGALLAIASVVTAIAQPLWGKIADERGLAPLLLTGGFGSLGTLSLLGLVDVMLVAVLATLLAGFTLAALVASASTAAVEAGKSRGMGAYMGLFHSAGSTGQAIMPLIYGLVLGTIGVDGLLVAVGTMVALGSVAFISTTRMPATASVNR